LGWERRKSVAHDLFDPIYGRTIANLDVSMMAGHEKSKTLFREQITGIVRLIYDAPPHAMSLIRSCLDHGGARKFEDSFLGTNN
jgi:hypothetical protein